MAKPPAPKRYFKIRHKASGLWSKGGAAAGAYGGDHGRNWNKNGKVWHGLGPLRLHLHLVMNEYKGNIADWEVVEYSMLPVETKPAHEMIDLMKMLKKR
jgi:hypothetical protein